MELFVQDVQKKLSVSDTIFDHQFNEALVHQVVVAYAAGARQGTSAQKNRAEVAGTGKKPWRQKGTGRARSGTVTSPIWRSGGITFPAKPRNYRQKINKKMYRGAIKSIFSELIRQNRLMLVEQLSIPIAKTKVLVQKLNTMALVNNVLIVQKTLDKNLVMAARSLYKVEVREITHLDPISLIIFDKIVITVDAIKQVEEMLV